MPISDLRRCALHCQCQAAWRGSARQRRVPLSCELGWREIAERGVRTARVVVLAPAADSFARIAQIAQAVEIEAFVAQLAVEALDVTVLGRPARRDVRKFDATAFAPGVEVAAAELGPVVAAQRARTGPAFEDALQHPCDLPRADPGVGFGGQAFAGELIDYGQHPQRPPVTDSVVHKVQCPLLIGPRELRQWHPPMGESPPRLAPQLKPRLPIQPIHPLVIDRVAAPAQLHPQPPITVARMALREFFQRIAQVRFVVHRARLVTRTGAVDRDQPARPPLAYRELAHHLPYRSAPGYRRKPFFAITDLSTSLSRLNSATICFSRRFSCSSCAIRRASASSTPAYRSRHR